MRINVRVPWSKIEEMCTVDFYYGQPVVKCADYEDVIEVDPSEAELDINDIEKIVRDYLDEVIDALSSDRKYLEELRTKLAKKGKNLNIY